jgi:hypothetical protein
MFTLQSDLVGHLVQDDGGQMRFQYLSIGWTGQEQPRSGCIHRVVVLFTEIPAGLC